MPRARAAKPTPSRPCSHHCLINESVTDASELGFERKTLAQRARASGTVPTASWTAIDQQFPAPLVLPTDDIALDPGYPSQSVRSWENDRTRNPVTKALKTIYVCGPPGIEPDCDFIGRWAQPATRGSKKLETWPEASTRIVAEYVGAFYHGVPVRHLDDSQLRFRRWDDEPTSSSDSHGRTDIIGLVVGDECVGIRTRRTCGSPYQRQLNLNDLIDAMIAALPQDAYAFVMLVHHDMYEDDNDEFVCGRAYGGSRVAVISTARYRPQLDDKHDVHRAFFWPFSHCLDCVLPMVEVEATPATREHIRKCRGRGTSWTESEGSSALRAAVRSLKHVGPESTADLWLSRLCRTVCHELGHCLGIDHCMYYACSMQGSASLAEDSRQPPYLCAVDLAKLLRATRTSPTDRYEALATFCSSHPGVHIFVAYEAWIRDRLRQMQEQS